MNKQYNNPALQEEPIGEPPVIIAIRENESIFRYLQSTGRFINHPYNQLQDELVTEELEDILYEEEEMNAEE